MGWLLMSLPSYWSVNGPAVSYPRPVEPPEVDPAAGTQIRVCFAEEWLPYVIGASKVLTDRATWQGDDAGTLLASYRARHLLSLLSEPVPGCYDLPPVGYWECHYNFLDSDGGWALRNTGHGVWGEWVYGEGWKATIAFNNAVNLYVKACYIETAIGSTEWVYAVTCNYSIYTLAPGGYQYKTVVIRSLSGSQIGISGTHVHPEGEENSTEWAECYPGFWGNKWQFDGGCGADTTPATLATCYLTLVSATIYGRGAGPDC